MHTPSLRIALFSPEQVSDRISGPDEKRTCGVPGAGMYTGRTRILEYTCQYQESTSRDAAKVPRLSYGTISMTYTLEVLVLSRVDIYVQTRRSGERVMRLLRRLFTELKLPVNESKSAVDLATRRKILGYSFWFAPGHVVIRRVSRNALQVMKDSVFLITRRTRGRSIVAVAAELRSYLVCVLKRILPTFGYTESLQ